jgi:hydrogenase expression/formation protein HypC
MCLAVPGRVAEIYDDRGTPMGLVDFGGVTKTICLAFTPEVGVGDYAIVHAGFAITVLDEDAAQETLELFEGLSRGLPESDGGVA